MYRIPLQQEFWVSYYQKVTFTNFWGTPDAKNTSIMSLEPLNNNYSVPPGSTGGGYSALAYAKDVSVSDFRLRVSATTVKQLRPSKVLNFFGGNGPSPIEVFWIGFNFQPVAVAGQDGSKVSNYFALKQSQDANYKIELGIMCGTQDNLGQTILASVPSYEKSIEPKFINLQAMGSPPIAHEYEITKRGVNLTVAVDGYEVLNYTNDYIPGKLKDPTKAEPEKNQCFGNAPNGEIFNQPGTFAMYVEDATAVVFDVCFQELGPGGSVVAP